MSLKVEGHLTSKSSPLAPVSCKLSKQFMVQQHLNAHYKNISKVKSSIDNKCPKSWYKHAITKDQLKKERLVKSARERNSNRSSPNIFQNKSSRSELEEDVTQTNNKMSYEEIKPLGPRIYKKDVKSKIAQLRCYNPPKLKHVAKPTNSNAVPINNQESVQEPHEQVKNDSRGNEEDLRYLNFCNDVTNDILSNDVYTDRGIFQIFDYHIKRNVYNLKMDKMLIAFDEIKSELQGKQDITRSNNYDLNRKDFSSDIIKPKPRSQFRNRTDFNYEIAKPNFEDDIKKDENYQNWNPTNRKSMDSDRNYYNYDFANPKSDNFETEKRNEFSENDLTLDLYESKNDFMSGDHSISKSFKKPTDENEDRNYLLMKRTDLSPDKSIENDIVLPQMKSQEFSTAPSALQWSLTSNEELDAYLKINRQKLTNEPSITEICEKVDNVQISESNNSLDSDAAEEKTADVEDSNANKNVHFANQNEVFSAPESDENDHSLTDVTSFRLEESDNFDENNDSTCAESSLDLNNTFKSDLISTNVIKYEDDFDD